MSRGRFAGNAGRGSHWISDKRRRAIYERDGWTCWVCGCRVVRAPALAAGASGELATLDHVIPRVLGGSNASNNLVTCCDPHNRARGDEPAVEWLINQEDGMDWKAALERLLSRVCGPQPACDRASLRSGCSELPTALAAE